MVGMGTSLHAFDAERAKMPVRGNRIQADKRTCGGCMKQIRHLTMLPHCGGLMPMQWASVGSVVDVSNPGSQFRKGFVNLWSIPAVLSRRIVSNGGSVLFNGKSLGSVEVKRLCCFIQQSDSFYGFLTVQEHLDCVVRYVYLFISSFSRSTYQYI